MHVNKDSYYSLLVHRVTIMTCDFHISARKLLSFHSLVIYDDRICMHELNMNKRKKHFQKDVGMTVSKRM